MQGDLWVIVKLCAIVKELSRASLGLRPRAAHRVSLRWLF